MQKRVKKEAKTHTQLNKIRFLSLFRFDCNVCGSFRFFCGLFYTYPGGGCIPLPKTAFDCICSRPVNLCGCAEIWLRAVKKTVLCVPSVKLHFNYVPLFSFNKSIATYNLHSISTTRAYRNPRHPLPW